MIKNKVLSLLKSNVLPKYLDEITNEINNLPNSVWIKYQEKINDYKSGMYSSAGWYASIFYSLREMGVNVDIADLLAGFRDKV